MRRKVVPFRRERSRHTDPLFCTHEHCDERQRACTCGRRWRSTERGGHPSGRAGAGRDSAAMFFHAVALKWLSDGDRYAAGEALKEAVNAWPDHRLAALDDPILANELL